jgi:glutathione synthase/RimK-type ligase-like ATP-grasp enzyme
MRVVVQPYKGGSKSAKALAEYLGVKRLKTYGSQFVGKIQDVIINWGTQRDVPGQARVLNNPRSVYKASNKLVALQTMESQGVSVPRYHTSLVGQEREGMIWVGREQLSGHSGQGIVLLTEHTTLINCPLYTEYIPKVREYRAIVVGDNVVDLKQKKKRRPVSEENPDGWEGEHDEHVWNLDGGYIFARDGINRPDGIDQLSVSAVSALGLDFGAVDIIEDASGVLYVLEVNTAFGLEGTTIELVGEAIKELL